MPFPGVLDGGLDDGGGGLHTTEGQVDDVGAPATGSMDLVLSGPRVQDRVRDAWAGLARVSELGRLEVVVQPRSALCPTGWVGVLRIDETVTVAVPDAGLVGQVRAVFAALPAVDATNPDVVMSHLPGISAVLGPASLYYAQGAVVPPSIDIVVASPAELDDLIGSVSAADLDESGLGEVTSPLFVATDEHGTPIAACGYQQWPARVAHLCVLTNREHRREGWGRAVAAAAIAHAIGEGLLPQWRARPEPSQALARSLRLTERGAQLSLRLVAADRP